MRLPWVSRRAYEFMEATVERLQRERDEQQSRADRLADQLLDRMSFAPVSAPVRAEMKQAAEELQKYEESLQIEDTGSGMLSPDILALVDDIAPANREPV